MTIDFETEDILEYGILAAGTLLPAVITYNATGGGVLSTVGSVAITVPSYMGTRYLLDYGMKRLSCNKSRKNRKKNKSGKKRRRKSYKKR